MTILLTAQEVQSVFVNACEKLHDRMLIDKMTLTKNKLGLIRECCPDDGVLDLEKILALSPIAATRAYNALSDVLGFPVKQVFFTATHGPLVAHVLATFSERKE